VCWTHPGFATTLTQQNSGEALSGCVSWGPLCVVTHVPTDLYTINNTHTQQASTSRAPTWPR